MAEFSLIKGCDVKKNPLIAYEAERAVPIVFLREMLEVRDGVLYWRERPRSHFVRANNFTAFNRHKAGRPAGGESSLGYMVVGFSVGPGVKARLFMAHRVIWAIHYGQWPDGEIDHIDHDPLNNRIENLRLADRTANCQNRRVKAGSKSRFLGVVWSGESGKWRAVCGIGGKKKHLGRFDSEAEAAMAYDAHVIAVLGPGANTNQKMGIFDDEG